MSRKVEVTLYIAVALCVVAAIVGVVILRSISGTSGTSGTEIQVTQSYAEGIRQAGYPITVQKAYEASSFGGWHGDGSLVTAYRYPPGESDALIAALKSQRPDFTWTETPSGAVTVGTVLETLPKEFLPSSDLAMLLVGRTPQGLPIFEFIVDRSRGTLYSVENRF